jgi:uncharacterized protein YkwD
MPVRPWKLGAAVMSTALLAAGGLAVSPSAEAATKSVEFGQPLVVSIPGVAKGQPVVVVWGDQTSTRVMGRCTVPKAARAPQKCSMRASHVYSVQGTYTVSISRRSRVLRTRTVEVLPPASSIPSETINGQTIANSWKQDMLNAVNDARAGAGVAPLVVCAPIEAAAQQFAQAMAEQGFFSHTGLDGSTSDARIHAQGYRGRTTGENIAAGHHSVDAAMQAWMDQPEHHAIIVSPDYKHVGFGLFERASAPLSPYWVQDFGAGGTC